MEIDPLEIWQNVVECIQMAVQNLVILDINPDDIVALAITNRRDTTVLWHKTNGRPLYNAIGEFYRFLFFVYVTIHIGVGMIGIWHNMFYLCFCLCFCFYFSSSIAQLGTIAVHRILLKGFCQKIKIKLIY